MSGSIVIASEFIFVTLFAVAVIATTVADMVRSGVWDRARWAMVGMILPGALGVSVQIPGMYHRLDDAVGVPNFAVLVQFLAYIACGGCMHLWISTWPSTTLTIVRGAPRKRTIGLVVIGGGVLLALLFAAGVHPDEEPAGSFVAYAHDPATWAMIFGYAVMYGGLWAWATVRMHRVRIASSAGGIRWLGSGLAVLEAGMAATVLYALAVAAVCASAVAGVRGPSWILAADSIAGVGAAMGCIAFSCRVWKPQLERLFGSASEKQTARMEYRQLRMLHKLVGSGAPVRMRRGLGLLRRDPTMALAYQIGRRPRMPHARHCDAAHCAAARRMCRTRTESAARLCPHHAANTAQHRRIRTICRTTGPTGAVAHRGGSFVRYSVRRNQSSSCVFLTLGRYSECTEPML
jgi:hypothetical protein